MAPNKKNPPPTLCWKCARATAAPELACSWSRHDDFCPVEGWEAEPSVNYNNSPENQRSYTVYACPLFMAEPEREVSPFYEYDEEQEPPKRSWGCEPGKFYFVELDGRWLTVAEYGRARGIHHRTVYRQISKGELRAVLSNCRPEEADGGRKC